MYLKKRTVKLELKLKTIHYFIVFLKMKYFILSKQYLVNSYCCWMVEIYKYTNPIIISVYQN